MAILIRRSNLLVPATDADLLRDAWRHAADAITLDLEGMAEARGMVKDAIVPAARGAAEVFVRVNKDGLAADLEASVWPGLRGIMLPQVESAADVLQAAEIVTGLERSRGLAPGSISFIVLLESARAVWDIRSIITASPRVAQAGLDEADLAASLGIKAFLKLEAEYDP